MILSSMTGFARRQDEIKLNDTTYRWVWEIKSVNAKGMDIKTKLPQWLTDCDEIVKKVLGKYFTRGTFYAALDIKTDDSEQEAEINEPLLNTLIAKLNEVYVNNQDLFNKPSPAELLKVSGVLNIKEKVLTAEELQLLKEALEKSFDLASLALRQNRRQEGAKIADALEGILQKIQLITQKVEDVCKNTAAKMREKLQKQIQDLVSSPDVSPERLEQEVLFLVMKADVREELDRLEAHIKTARELLAEGEFVGRRLDFLCQELNREANTLCSKSADIEQTKYGMELKALIEQFREQIQNVE